MTGLSVQSRGGVLINWRRNVRPIVGCSDLQRHGIELCTMVLDYGWSFWWLGRELFGLTWNGNWSVCSLWAGKYSAIKLRPTGVNDVSNLKVQTVQLLDHTIKILTAGGTDKLKPNTHMNKTCPERRRYWKISVSLQVEWGGIILKKSWSLCSVWTPLKFPHTTRAGLQDFNFNSFFCRRTSMSEQKPFTAVS